MPVGTSLGGYYEDETDHAIKTGVAPATDPHDDNMVVTPDQNEKDMQNKKDLKGVEENELGGTPIANRIDVYQGEKPDLPNIDDVPHHDWVESTIKGIGSGISHLSDIAEGRASMWALDQSTGEIHTSPEGIAAGSELAGAAMYGSAAGTSVEKAGLPAIIHLQGEGHEALTAGEDAFQEFLAGRGARQESNIVESEGHPMTPVEASMHFNTLRARNEDTIPFTDDYYARATPEQLTQYERHVTDPRSYMNANGTLRQMEGEDAADYAMRSIEHVLQAGHYDPGRESPWQHHLSTFTPHTPPDKSEFFNQLAEAKKSANIKLIENKEFNFSGSRREFKFASEKGTGNISLTETDGGRNLYIDGIMSDKGMGYYTTSDTNHQFGKTDMKDLLKQLMVKFPKAETIEGFRVSGARNQAGKTGKAKMKLPRK